MATLRTVTNHPFLTAALDFEQATTNQQKSKAVLDMIKSGPSLMGAFPDDKLTTEDMKDEKIRAKKSLKNLSVHTRDVIQIVQLGVMKKELLAHGMHAHNYMNGVNDIIERYLQTPDVHPDLIATASYVLSDCTSDQSDVSPVALNMATTYAFAIAKCPQNDHFANDEDSTNKDEALNVLGCVYNETQGRYKEKRGPLGDAVNAAGNLYQFLAAEKGDAAVQTEAARREAADPVAKEVHFHLNRMFMVQKIAKNHPAIADLTFASQRQPALKAS